MSHLRGNTGTLIVVVTRAKDLPNKRKMEKQSPYCLLRIMNLTDKTKADVRGGQTPKWDEEFRFNITPELQPVLKLSVLDETKKSSVLIAETEIDFTPVFYSSVKEGYDNWYPLTFAGKESGEIYLEMTFYPSSVPSLSNSGSISGSYYKKATIPNNSNFTKRRILPPIPGQNLEIEEVVEEDPHAIPPPILRMSEIRESNMHSSRRSGEFYHSDSFRPNSVLIDNSRTEDDVFNTSTISVHSLPDVPSHSSKNMLPKQSLKYEIPINNQKSDTTYDKIFQNSLDPGREEKTYDLKAFAKNFASKYNISLFNGGNNSNRDTSDSSKHSSNAFDELEREVQSDWAKNNPTIPTNHHRSPSPQKRAPPPVPSHGSSLGSSTSSHVFGNNSQATRPEVSYSNYEIIEPNLKSEFDNQGRKSPTRKVPSEFTGYSLSPGRKSPERALPQTPTAYEIFTQERKKPERALPQVPSAYEMFTQHPNLKDSVRSSPSRFKSSLPEPPRD